MAQHIITISDEDSGVSVLLQGQGVPDTPAGLAARMLAELAGPIVRQAAEQARRLGTCTCAKCVAAKQAAQTEPKPTLH